MELPSPSDPKQQVVVPNNNQGEGHQVDKVHSSRSGYSVHLGASLIHIPRVRSSIREMDDRAIGATFGLSPFVRDLPTDTKLSLPESFMYAFCIAFGPVVALVSWYAKLAGFWGFLLVLIVVGAAGATAGNAIHRTAIATKATSFAELTEMLPVWMGKITSYAQVLWGWMLLVIDVQFCFAFVNYQFFGGAVPDQGLGSMRIYLINLVVMFIITAQPSLKGSCMKYMTYANLIITWAVIFLAIIKGIYMPFTEEQAHRPTHYDGFVPQGIMQVVVLCSTSLFQCAPIPQLQCELKDEVKNRAARVMPIALAVLHGTVFMIMGSIGYWALGPDRIVASGDVFESFYIAQPDLAVTLLQAGITVLIILTLPLVVLFPKAELWALFARSKDGGPKPFSEAPLCIQLLLNLVVLGVAYLVAGGLGRKLYVTVFTCLSGFVATWLNMLLPVFIIIYAYIIPARAAGQPWVRGAFKALFVAGLAVACLVSTILNIVSLASGQ